jgi:tetrathionate reductase subunit B
MDDREKNTDLSRRRFIQVALAGAAGVWVGTLTAFAEPGTAPELKSLEDLSKFEWGYLVDTTRCIGCGSCVRACSAENNVPDGFYRTWVERYEIDVDHEVEVDSPRGAIESFKTDQVQGREAVKAFFVPKICNHCRASACTQVCPVGASFHSPDGVVLIDRSRCVGCGYCVQACPYGCRYIDHDVGTADKCTLCYHRLHRDLTTACVTACPRQARLCGNLKDPDSPLRRVLDQRRYGLLKADMGTDPKCFYLGLDLEVI